MLKSSLTTATYIHIYMRTVPAVHGGGGGLFCRHRYKGSLGGGCTILRIRWYRTAVRRTTHRVKKKYAERGYLVTSERGTNFYRYTHTSERKRLCLVDYAWRVQMYWRGSSDPRNKIRQAPVVQKSRLFAFRDRDRCGSRDLSNRNIFFSGTLFF